VAMNWRASEFSAELVLAERAGDMPPIVQDDHALAIIDANAPLVPYPLLNEDRQTAPLRLLVWWLFRLVWWRWKSWDRRGDRWIAP
jgi:hypothetical protein